MCNQSSVPQQTDQLAICHGGVNPSDIMDGGLWEGVIPSGETTAEKVQSCLDPTTTSSPKDAENSTSADTANNVFVSDHASECVAGIGREQSHAARSQPVEKAACESDTLPIRNNINSHSP